MQINLYSDHAAQLLPLVRLQVHDVGFILVGFGILVARRVMASTIFQNAGELFAHHAHLLDEELLLAF